MALQITTNDVLLSLQTMGYTQDYISRAIAVHKKSRKGTNYDLSLLVEIITRLKSKDISKQRQSVTPKRFKSHFDLNEALKLNINDNVDYRFENGRVILCKIIDKTMDSVILLHPLGEPLIVTKHNRYCDLYTEYHKLAAPKSLSLRKLKSALHPLYDVQINDYIDINPMYKPGHKGWKYGRIIKIDPKSSQIKVLYHYEKDNNNYSYWIHLENVNEAAPFKTKSDDIICRISDDEEMYDNPTMDSTPTPSGNTPCRLYKYSMESILSTAKSSHESLHKCSADWMQTSIDSTFSIDSHAPLNVTNGHLMVINDKDEILQQLYTFGYNDNDIMTARENVTNPDDINEIVEYLTTLDMEKVLKAAIDEPLPQSPKKHEIMSEMDDESETKSDQSGIFGVQSILLSSTLILDKDYGAPIPNILIKLKNELFKNNGQFVEGIFRIHPDHEKCKQLQYEINNHIENIDFAQIDSVLIAGLIKLWFKNLPQPIFADLDDITIKQCKNMNIAGSIIENDIGEPNESYFKWLLDLCIDITKHEKVNKMSIKNMAIVIAPNLYNSIKAKTLSLAMVKMLQLSILWRHFSKIID